MPYLEAGVRVAAGRIVGLATGPGGAAKLTLLSPHGGGGGARDSSAELIVGRACICTYTSEWRCASQFFRGDETAATTLQ
jgi:hypothetical protein